MTTLRKNLKNEMDSRGWNATVLSENSGVPQPTIQRFLSGTHGDPRSSTIQKLAKGLGTTEAALRGFEEAEKPVPLYENIEKLSKENRALIEQMVNTLVQAQSQTNPVKAEHKALTSPAENVGGGGVKEPSALYSVANTNIHLFDDYLLSIKQSCKDADCYREEHTNTESVPPLFKKYPPQLKHKK